MVTSPVGAPSVTVTVLPSTMCRVTWAATSTIPVAMQVGCAGLGGGALGVPCSVSPLFCPLSPAVSSPLCCQQHSEEVCESCVVKTTLTAENAVEANKLSNNYKVGSHRAGWGGISWLPSGFSHLKISLYSSASRNGRATLQHGHGKTAQRLSKSSTLTSTSSVALEVGGLGNVLWQHGMKDLLL